MDVDGWGGKVHLVSLFNSEVVDRRFSLWYRLRRRELSHCIAPISRRKISHGGQLWWSRRLLSTDGLVPLRADATCSTYYSNWICSSHHLLPWGARSHPIQRCINSFFFFSLSLLRYCVHCPLLLDLSGCWENICKFKFCRRYVTSSQLCSQHCISYRSNCWHTEHISPLFFYLPFHIVFLSYQVEG